MNSIRNGETEIEIGKEVDIEIIVDCSEIDITVGNTRLNRLGFHSQDIVDNPTTIKIGKSTITLTIR